MRALLRWIRADLRSHRLPSLLVVIATAGTVAALLLAGTLLGAAFDPWQQAFRAADAPQVRIDTLPPPGTPGDDPALSGLSQLQGVTGVTAQQHTAGATLIGLTPSAGAAGTGDHIPLTLRGDIPGAPRPRLVSGSWLDPRPASGAADGQAGGPAGDLVLERSAADAAWARPGDRLSLLDARGQVLKLHVVGIADSPDQVSYPSAGYGLGWVEPVTLNRIEPDPSLQGRTIGLHLADPGNADYLAQRAVTGIGSDHVVRLSTWLDARASQVQGSRLTGLLLGLSGLAALLAAALAVAGAAGGRIRGRTGDIALLKALGFTPGQVVRMFVVEHLLLAGTGVLLGAGLALLLAPGLGGTSGPLPVGPSVAGAVTGISLAVIGLAVALPAYRASRVLPVPPAEGIPPSARAPRPARLGTLRRFPPAVVLGLSIAVRNRGAAAVTVLRLAVPMLACTLALSTWATLDAVGRGGEGSATRSTLTVRLATDTGSGARQGSALPAELAADRSVSGVYPSAELQALAPGQSATLTLRALGTTAHPFPFTVVQGHGIQAPDEAVAGQAALDLLHVQIGQWVRLTTGGTPRILHIVGRNLEPDLNGRVISTGWDSLDRPGDPAQAAFYSVVLRPGSNLDQVRADLPRTTGLGSSLDVRPSPDAAAQLTGLRGSVIGLVALLALIALAELLTTAAAGIRDHRHDLGLLRAIGLTPRQAGATMAVRGVALALAGVALGTLLGIPMAERLINQQGRSDGIGAGIAHAPTLTAVLVLVCATALAAATTSAVPALRAARVTSWPFPR